MVLSKAVLCILTAEALQLLDQWGVEDDQDLACLWTGLEEVQELRWRSVSVMF